MTIATGVDLKSKNRKYFEDLGVDSRIIDKLEPYFGKKGQDAENLLKRMPLVLTDPEANDLSDKVFKGELNRIKRLYNKEIGKHFFYSDVIYRTFIEPKLINNLHQK